MTPPFARRSPAALLAVLALAACAGAPAPATSPAPAAPASTADPAPGVVTSAPAQGTPAELAAIAQARRDSARLAFTAADVEFMTMMIAHHAQAIVMAEMAPTHGASTAVRTLAGRIVNAQRDEIGIAQRWLRDRGQPVPDVSPGGAVTMPAAPATAGGAPAAGAAHHGAHHGAGHAAMPGMLTEAQLRELDAARGRDFDRLFLTFMIQHHRGAVAMVEQLFGSYGAGQDETVFKFASDVNVDQTTEIARMQQMLATIVFEGRDP